MILNANYTDKTIHDKLKTLVGEPFSPNGTIKTSTLNSSIYQITTHSDAFKEFIEKNQLNLKANIKLRSKGIVVVLYSLQDVLIWAIPYHFLSIYKTDSLGIHAEGEFINLSLENNHYKKLMEKIFMYKSKYLNP